MNDRVRRYGSESSGAPPRVLLHGWGFDGAVIEPLAERLSEDGRVLVVDLPGFRANDTDSCGTDPGAIAEAACRAVGEPARWTGWSLGGLVALKAAERQPDRVLGIDLLAATPRFVATDDWPGIPAGDLEGFVHAVTEDPPAAHRRFLGFQLAGSEGARPVLRQLRDCSERNGLPPARTLIDGLAILRDSDLRATLAALSCPLRAVLGAADPLVPSAVAPGLTAMGVDVRLVVGAGHVPFLSHPEAVLTALREP